MELRPYQQAARAAVEGQWAEGNRRTLLVLPTGCGKTVVFCKIVEDRVRQGDRCLILAHRGELLAQAADKLAAVSGLHCAVEQGDQSALGSWFRVTVGSVQSLMREKRLRQFPPDYYGTIIVDEAHHILSESYLRVLDHFPQARVLGVTATPDRGDLRNLGQFFQSLAYEYTLPQAIREGYLCPIRALTLPLKLDLSAVSVQAGDFQASGLDTALDPCLEEIAAQMAEHCRDRKTVVFLPLVKTAQKFRDILNARGFRAAQVSGQSQDRQAVLEGFQAGRYNVLCNSMLLTEGWDCPGVDCVVVLRPTKVRSLYAQMVGRGTRLAPGKDHLLLLDFLWHTERHELCHPASLICEDAAVARQMTEHLEAAGAAMDLEEAVREATEDVVAQREEAVREATEDVVAQREEALAKELAAQRRKKARLVDPLQFEMSIQAQDLAGYVPAFGWEAAPATEKQRQALERLGICPDEITCAGKASLLLDRLDKRRREGLTTPKQIRFLEQKGFRQVGTWSFDTARALIDRIAANGWRVPRGLDPATYHETR